MSEKFDEFMLDTDVRLEQLEGRVEAQQLVIALLLNELDKTPHFQSDVILRFLSRQANEMDGNPEDSFCVDSIDELRGYFLHLASLRKSHG